MNTLLFKIIAVRQPPLAFETVQSSNIQNSDELLYDCLKRQGMIASIFGKISLNEIIPKDLLLKVKEIYPSMLNNFSKYNQNPTSFQNILLPTLELYKMELDRMDFLSKKLQSERKYIESITEKMKSLRTHGEIIMRQLPQELKLRHEAEMTYEETLSVILNDTSSLNLELRENLRSIRLGKVSQGQLKTGVGKIEHRQCEILDQFESNIDQLEIITHRLVLLWNSFAPSKSFDKAYYINKLDSVKNKIKNRQIYFEETILIITEMFRVLGKSSADSLSEILSDVVQKKLIPKVYQQDLIHYLNPQNDINHFYSYCLYPLYSHLKEGICSEELFLGNGSYLKMLEDRVKRIERSSSSMDCFERVCQRYLLYCQQESMSLPIEDKKLVKQVKQQFFIAKADQVSEVSEKVHYLKQAINFDDDSSNNLHIFQKLHECLHNKAEKQYLKTLDQICSEESPIKMTGVLSSAHGTYYLKESVYDKLKAAKSEQGNKHKVIKIGALYIKIDPEFPANQYATGSLYRMLMDHSTSFGEFVKIENTRTRDLDYCWISYSQEKGLEEKNDTCSVETLTNINHFDWKQLSVKTIVYYITQMADLIHDTVGHKQLFWGDESSITELLENWLLDLHYVNEQSLRLFDTEQQQLQSGDRLTQPIEILVFLHPMMVSELYYKLLFIQNEFKNTLTEMSNQALFQCIYPELPKHYELWGGLASKLQFNKAQDNGYYIETAVINNAKIQRLMGGEQYLAQPKECLKKLRSFVCQIKNIDITIKEFLMGNFNNFKLLPPHIKSHILTEIDFRHFDVPYSSDLHEEFVAILRTTSFKELCLINNTSLTNSMQMRTWSDKVVSVNHISNLVRATLVALIIFISWAAAGISVDAHVSFGVMGIAFASTAFAAGVGVADAAFFVGVISVYFATIAAGVSFADNATDSFSAFDASFSIGAMAAAAALGMDIFNPDLTHTDQYRRIWYRAVQNILQRSIFRDLTFRHHALIVGAALSIMGVVGHILDIHSFFFELVPVFTISSISYILVLPIFVEIFRHIFLNIGNQTGRMLDQQFFGVSFETLRQLDISGCVQISDTDYIGEKFSDLEKLNLSKTGAEIISSRHKDYMNLPSGERNTFRNLRVLKAENMPRLRSVHLENECLEEVYLQGCELLNNVTVKSPKLRKVDLKNCDQLRRINGKSKSECNNDRRFLK